MEHEHTKGLYGSITHTELASNDPDATRAWAEQALGWQFQPSIPTPAGDYHLYAYSQQGGGGASPTRGSRAPAASRSSMSKRLRMLSTRRSRREPNRSPHRRV